MAKRYGVLGTIDTLQIDNRILVDMDNLILAGAENGGNPFATLRKQNGSAGYQVTALKTFKELAIKLQPAGSAMGLNIGYGDTDVGFNSASAPTTPKYIFGGTSGGTLIYATANTKTELAFVFEVPASKYPHIGSSGANTCMIFGYEV